MNTKLIVLDVDGTLTDEKGKISPENISAVKTALKEGIEVALATGRPLQGVESICKELGLNGPLILNNGSLILSGNEIWLEKHLSQDELISIFNHGINIGNMVILTFQPDVVKYWIPLGMNCEKIEMALDSFSLNKRVKVNSLYYLPTQRVNKAMYLGNEQVIERAIQLWPENLSHLDRGRSYPYLGEINCQGVSKGEALSIVCDRLGISTREVLAIGDGETDIPMLSISGKAVFIARNNKMPKLPEHACVISKDESNHGVAWALDNYLK